MSRVVVVSALALGSVACSPKEVNYSLTVVTTGCASANPFQGVQYLRIRILGDGLEAPIEVIEPAANKTAVLPQIPKGSNRVIEVRTYNGDPVTGAQVVSVGRTLPFTVPDVVPDASDPELQKFVVLRQVNSWVQPVSVTERERCQSMKTARAAHTATLLPNGKVYIAGGFNFPQGSQQRVALMQAELFDPSTGVFTPVKDLSYRSPGGVETKVTRAFQTATLLKNGQVMLWGGESYQLLMGTNAVTPAAEVLFYEWPDDRYGVTRRQTPPAIARTQHRAAMDKDGRVLIVGGLRFNTSGVGPRLLPVNEVEWFEPSQMFPQIVDGLQVQRADATAVTVKSGEFIAVAGGSDGTALQDQVLFFSWNGTTFAQQQQANPPRLAAPGRRAAAGATFRDGADMLVLGGYSDPAVLRPVQSVEIVQSATTAVARGSDVGDRGELCAVTLKDGSVLAIGGRTADQAGMMVRSDNRVIIVRPDERGGTNSRQGPNLTIGRYLHTCTLLADGSVLVLGGVNETPQNTIGEVLGDAWIFTPAPTD